MCFDLIGLIIIAGMEHGSVDWITTDIETRIKETHDDPNLIHQIGVVKNISVSSSLNV